MKLSVVIPAHNEAENIRDCVTALRRCISEEHGIPAEYIIVDDNSSDGTVDAVLSMAQDDPRIRLISREAPPGFGRAIRTGCAAVTGDVVVIYMADSSDHPADVLAYYRKIQEGYDCVFGSRFIPGSRVEHYPRLKLIINRVVNNCVRWMFWTKFNDLTNAFKAYRTEVIQACGPFNACHFNITLEMSLGALIRRYYIAQIPIGWSGRTWGSSKLRLHEMGRRYLSTLLMMFFQRMLISDDLLADRLAMRREMTRQHDALERRVHEIETKLSREASNRVDSTSALVPGAPAGTESPQPPR